MKETNRTEEHLVRRILSGDEKALKFFYDKFRVPLSGYISKKIAEPQDREEIFSDTLLSTIEGLRDFSFRCSLFTFICSIANHKIIDFYRRKKIKKIVFSKFEQIEPFLTTVFGPEDALNEEFVREKIREAFERIPPLQRKILNMKYIQGYSVSEIADRLSVTFKSAESELFRARKAFAKAYLP